MSFDPKMTPEQQQVAIAKALGLVPAEESGLSLAQLSLLDGHSSLRPQYITDGWVSTDPKNPQGVWLRGGCSQAVADKSIAEKWAAYHGDKLVVQVKMLRDIPDYLNDLNAMHAALKSQTQGFRAEFDRLLHAIAQEKAIFLTELEAKDWADGFISCLKISTRAGLESEVG